MADKSQSPEQKAYATHCALIQLTEKVPLAQARFMAWLEGQAGLQTRLQSAGMATPPAGGK